MRRSRHTAIGAGRYISTHLAVAALALVLSPGLHAATSTLTYSGDSMTTVLSEGSQRAVLTGHARVETEDTVIRADRIELYGKDFIYALCKGAVKVVNTKKGIELTSEQLFYDREGKISRISGNAVMTDIKNELVVKGGFIEDRDSEQLTVIQIGVRILKKDLVCRAEFARYYREKKTLELSGMPKVNRKGDEYEAARINVNLDTEEIALEGDVKGEIVAEQKKSSEEGGTESPPVQATPENEGQASPATGDGAGQPKAQPEPAGHASPEASNGAGAPKAPARNGGATQSGVGVQEPHGSPSKEGRSGG